MDHTYHIRSRHGIYVSNMVLTSRAQVVYELCAPDILHELLGKTGLGPVQPVITPKSLLQIPQRLKLSSRPYRHPVFSNLDAIPPPQDRNPPQAFAQSP